MKNLTVGKLITVIYSVIFICNLVMFYLSSKDPKFDQYTKDGFWPIFTGITILISISIFVYAFLNYIVKNWNKEIF